jgi:hypothetical protein
MEEEKTIIAFANTNWYPVSVNIKGIRNKVGLEPRQRITDREGVPIIPLKSEWGWLIKMGIKPVYLNASAMAATLAPELRDRGVMLDDVTILSAKQEIEPKTVIEKIETPVEVENATAHLEDPNNPNPTKADLVWQNPDGEWTFNKDGTKNINPAAIKKHIRKTLGKDYLEQVSWQASGTGAVKPEEDVPPVV